MLNIVCWNIHTLKISSQIFPKQNGELRIIGGKWRSRKISIADFPGLRPTSNRVRETLFNWIAPYVTGAKTLECFGGTGALSLEALSRGAKQSFILETAPTVVDVLHNNRKNLAAENVQIINVNALSWLCKPADTSFDLIFLDPPFRKNLLKETCLLLNINGYVHSKTLIYVEVEKQLLPLPTPENWSVKKWKTAGQLNYYLLQHIL